MVLKRELPYMISSPLTALHIPASVAPVWKENRPSNKCQSSLDIAQIKLLLTNSSMDFKCQIYMKP